MQPTYCEKKSSTALSTSWSVQYAISKPLIVYDTAQPGFDEAIVFGDDGLGIRPSSVYIDPGGQHVVGLVAGVVVDDVGSECVGSLARPRAVRDVEHACRPYGTYDWLQVRWRLSQPP
jgi:hypothetical protein